MTMTATQEISLTEYRIATHNLDRLNKSVEKLNKRAAKLDLDIAPITVTVLRTEQETVKVGVNVFGEDIMEDRDWSFVTVEGEPVVIAGWGFLATIEHTEAGNVIRRLPGNETEIDLSAYRTTGRVCDHCKMDRRRNDTYIVVDELGNTQQVGSSCLADFIGVDSRDPQRAASWLDGWYTLMQEISDGEMGDDESFGGGRSEYAFSIEGFMATVAACVRDRGWLAKGQAWREDRVEDATANLVMEYLTARPPFVPAWKPQLDQAQYENLKAEMTEAIEWARSIDENTENEYLSNLRISVMNNTVNSRRAGIVASLYIAFAKHQEREAKRAAAKAAKPVSVKPLAEGRQVIEGEVIGTKWVEGFAYDTSTLKMRVLNTDNNVVFGSVPAALENDVQVGTKIRFTATVQVKEQDFGYFKRPSKAEIL